MRGDDDAIAFWNVQNVTSLTNAGGKADDNAMPTDDCQLWVFTGPPITPGESFGSKGDKRRSVYVVQLVEDNVGRRAVGRAECIEAINAELDSEEPQLRWSIARSEVSSCKSCDGSYRTLREAVRLWRVRVGEGLMDLELVADVLESSRFEFEALI